MPACRESRDSAEDEHKVEIMVEIKLFSTLIAFTLLPASRRTFDLILASQLRSEYPK